MAIILDTMVVSETTRAQPDPAVLRWFSRQDPLALYLASPTVAELSVGIERLPKGMRRGVLESWLQRIVGRDFRGRVLPFESDTALAYGRLAASAFAAGRPPSIIDTQIAATALVHGMSVATRNVRDFMIFGLAVENPWQTGRGSTSGHS
jgi:toxin FitB